ncbi:MAG: hypothetical protein AAGA54_05065 [Myxococcota bacterium]
MATSRQPAVRGRAAQDALRSLDAFEAGATARARANIPAASLAVVDETPARGWIPLEHDRHVPSSIIAALGPRANAYFRTLLVRQLEAPLLRSTWSATRRLLGISPAALVRALPLGWPIIYRDFGTITVLPQRRTTSRVRFGHVHPSVFAEPAYPESFAGFFGGFFEACKVEGVVDVSLRPDDDEMLFTLQW